MQHSASSPRSTQPATAQAWEKQAYATAALIRTAFEKYHEAFKAITWRTQIRFARRDWQGGQADAVERLLLYSTEVQRIVHELQSDLGENARNKTLWRMARNFYATAIARRSDLELAETFFNSVVRRLCAIIGIDASIEFIWFGPHLLPTGDSKPIYHSYVWMSDMGVVVRAILSDYQFAAPYADAKRDAKLVAATIEEELSAIWQATTFDAIEIANAVFYRNKGAYLVGRIRKRNQIVPLLIPLIHGEQGVVVDNVLLTEREAHRVFSYTHSYFHVESPDPAELVGFLKTIMPAKTTAELYTSIGYHKHGKRLFYQELYQHLNHSIDKFEIARGVRGMVMTVFTLPSLDVVFKIIRDRFAQPKTTTREEVKEHYRLVFKHDRVGRMVDAQEFEYLTFNRDRFTPELLVELQSAAAESVTITDEEVIFRHLYTERRIYPLDLYVKEMSLSKVHHALLDYGQALRDLAAANIFPGDLFFKNFGVTTQGRVVLYDYDEVSLLTQCNFRNFPQARSYEEEVAAETWYVVGPNDIFPEEFRTFLWLPEPLRTYFVNAHADLFSAEFWQHCQQRVSAGEVLDIYPYERNEKFGATT